KKGVYLRAIGFLKESSEKFKDRNPTVLYHLGLAYSKKGDITLAKESLSKALKLDPAYNQVRLALATVYLAVGDQEKGEQELALAAKSDPENEELLHIVGTY